MNTKLDHALSLAELGFRVFPLIPNSKTPTFKRWTEKATADRAIIKAHWQRHPDDNIAILTGEGLIVLDEDNKHETKGSDTLFGLELANGDLPATLTNITPTEGKHYLFRSDIDIHNSVSRIGDELDVRGYHGFIVAPGSTLNGQPYQWANPAAELAQAPPWLEEMALRANPRLPKQSDIPLNGFDHPQAISRAQDYLRSALPAVQGDHGDLTTLKTAMHLKDFGLSEGAAIDLMLDVYNERCSPPWHPDEMLIKVGNAYRYGKNQPGIADPVADFGVEPVVESAVNDSTRTPKKALELADIDLVPIPTRKFILGKILTRGKITVLIAPPGAGKTTFGVNICLAVASGRVEPTGIPVAERCPVWYFNNEDDVDELNRRFAAAMSLFSITRNDITRDGKLLVHVNSGEHDPLLLAKRGGSDNKKVIATDDVEEVIREVKRLSIGVVFLDPYIELHQSDENDNVQMDQVARIARRIAQEGNCAAVIVHHTRKRPSGSSDGFAGDMDSGRGAGALNGKARAVLTFYGMSEKDAEAYGVPIEDHVRYVRLDDAKNNLALMSARPRWFERVGVQIGGFEGEEVGALKPIELAERGNAVSERVVLARDVLGIMEPEIEPNVLIRHIIARLKDTNPIYRAEQNDTLGKRLKRTLALPIEVDGWKILCEKGGWVGAHWSIIVTAASNEDGLDGSDKTPNE